MKFQVDKSQITDPTPEREVHTWQDQDNAEYQRKTRRVMVPERRMVIDAQRDERGTLYEVEFQGGLTPAGGTPDTYPLNQLPPGMFVDNQNIPPMPEEMPFKNSWDADVTKLTPADVRSGFKSSHQSSTEEQSNTAQPFYDEAEGTDEAGNKYTGFLERRNFGDRN